MALGMNNSNLFIPRVCNTTTFSLMQRFFTSRTEKYAAASVIRRTAAFPHPTQEPQLQLAAQLAVHVKQQRTNEQIDTPPKHGDEIWIQNLKIHVRRTKITKHILNTSCYGVAPSARGYGLQKRFEMN